MFTPRSRCPCRDNAFCFLRQAPLSVSAYADRGAFLAPAVFRQPTCVAITAFFLLGELVECDETAQIFRHPRDRRTEDYITGRFG